MMPAKLLTWSPWYSLQDCWRVKDIPTAPGLYRVRRAGRDFLDYVGQTGTGAMSLRRRLAMLVGVYAAEMPYSDPHTAGPALWALRQLTGEPFEVSVVPVEGLTPWRKGLEALAISLHRQEHGRSPTVNFGRMPAGYSKSSGNNQKLVLAGKRFRGGTCFESDARHLVGIAPAGPLEGDPQGPSWCGHSWSPWGPVCDPSRLTPPTSCGLYRLRDAGKPGLLYIGEGLVTARLAAHMKKSGAPGNRQGAIFLQAASLEWSWVTSQGWHAHQRLELENDLIAAHLMATKTVPAAQFLG